MIIINQPISRAKIASLSGINKVTVSNCIDYFLEKGIIHEIGTSGVSRGRPAKLLSIKGDAGVIIGLDTDIYLCRVLVTDLSGKNLEQRTLPLNHNKPETFLSFIENTVKQLKIKYSHYQLGVVGFGIALPGHYNILTGEIEYVGNFKYWDGYPIKAEIDKLNLDIPFFIDTIANAGARGEIHFGQSNVSKDLVFISSFWGLGVGVYTKGSIFSGNSGFAGRLGHSTIHINGRKCVCGNNGCWETYASTKALYEQLYPNQPNSREIIQAMINNLDHNDPKMTQALHELSYYLVMGLVNIVNAYNPNEICIGGYLGLLLTNMRSTIKSNLYERIPQHFSRDLEVYCSSLGEFGASYGAVSIVKDHLSDIFIEL
ncbi:ROK family protein [Radiobacillus sp. PE A8.2]|uniref:ROK family protein n=1 Tax=Radiobacillus sp. PE A8.2 TaxID=3380349 RepID=UPI00388E4AF3